MVKGNSILIFVIGFICAWILFSASLKNARGEYTSVPNSVSFSGENNVIYFFDRSEAKLYRYNTQGRITRIYVLKELGKDLQSR